MKIRIENRVTVNAYVLIYSYGGIEYMLPMQQENKLVLSTQLHEQSLKNLMNLCILELNDIKRQNVIKHDEDKNKIKFIGVDYR